VVSSQRRSTESASWASFDLIICGPYADRFRNVS
jgi:hypothetical protein